MNENEKWDLRFLELARHISQWSKDPSIKVGAVITDNNNRVISQGYNGLPRGVYDAVERYENRAVKLQVILHAEKNAILFAKCDLTGFTLYTWPFMSCAQCAAMVIQSGISRCVAPETPEDIGVRWQESTDLSKQMFFEAGVKLDLFEVN